MGANADFITPYRVTAHPVHPELTWGLGKIRPEGLTQRALPSPARSARWVSITRCPLKTNNSVSRGAGWQWTVGPERPERWFMEADCCQERDFNCKANIRKSGENGWCRLGGKTHNAASFSLFHVQHHIFFCSISDSCRNSLFLPEHLPEDVFPFLSPSHSFKL